MHANRLTEGAPPLDAPFVDAALRHQRREDRAMFLLTAPALIVVVALLLAPLVWLAWQSIYADGFTLVNYRRIFTQSVYWDTFALTFKLSAIVTVVTLLLGYPVAYAASALPPRLRIDSPAWAASGWPATTWARSCRSPPRRVTARPCCWRSGRNGTAARSPGCRWRSRTTTRRFC